jgi:hypothetical protein
MLKHTPRPASSVFLNEHAAIRERLTWIDQEAGSVSEEGPEEQRATLRAMVRVLEEQVLPQATWAEAHLYPLVDGLAGSGRDRFTSTLRHQHRLIEGSIRSLVGLAAAARMPGEDLAQKVRAFVRQTDRLLGLLSAHLDSEEKVLLEVVDRSLTAEQFEVLVARPSPDAS